MKQTDRGWNVKSLADGADHTFILGMAPPPDLDALSPAELKALVAGLRAEMAALRRLVSEQREEIARLKGLKGRPSIR